MTATNRESDHVIPDGCRDGCEHETLPADGPPVEDRLEQSEFGCFIVEFDDRSDNGPRHVGPFSSPVDADRWVQSQRFAYAAWCIVPIVPAATS